MDAFGMTVMFIFTPAFMALAFLLMFGVKRSEPRQAVSTLAATVETAGDADFGLSRAAWPYRTDIP